MSSKLLGIEDTETDRHDVDSQDANLATFKDTVGKILSCPRLQSEVQEKLTTWGTRTSAGAKTALTVSASEKTTMTKNASSCDDNGASLEGATSALTYFSLNKSHPTRRHSDDISVWSEKEETRATLKRRNPARKQTERRNSLDFHFEPTSYSDFAGRDDFKGKGTEGRGGWGTALTSSLQGITTSLVGSKSINGDESNFAIQDVFWQKDKSQSLSPQQTNRSSNIQQRIVDALAGSFTSLSEERVRKTGDAVVGSNKSDDESGEADQFETIQSATMEKSKKTPSSHMHKSMPVPVPVARSGRSRGHKQNTNVTRRSDYDFNSNSNVHVSPSIKAHLSKEPCIDHDRQKASTSSKIRPLHREVLQLQHSYHDYEVENVGEDLDQKNEESRTANPDRNTNTNHPVNRTLLRAGSHRRHSNQRRRSDSNHDDFEKALSESLSGPKARRRSSLSNHSLQDNTVDNRDHPVYKTLHRVAKRRSVSFDQQQMQGNREQDEVSEPKLHRNKFQWNHVGMDRQVLFPQLAPISNSTRRRSSITSDSHDDRLRRNIDHPASHTLRRTRKYRQSSFDQVEGIRMSSEKKRINKANATFEEMTTANAPYDVVFPRSVKLSNIRRCSSMSEYEVQHKMNHPVYKTLLRVHKLRRSSIDEDETHHPESEQIKKNWFGDISDTSAMSTIQRQGSRKHLNLVNNHGKGLPKHIPVLSHSYQPSQSRRSYQRGDDLRAADDHRLFRGNRVRDDYVTIDPIQNLVDSFELQVVESTMMSQSYKTVSMIDIQSEDNTIHPKRVAQGSNLETTSHDEGSLHRLESTKAERASSEQDMSPQRALFKRERSSSLTQQILGDPAVELESSCKPPSHSPE